MTNKKFLFIYYNNYFKVTLRDYLINLQSYSKDFEHMYDDKEIA